MHSDRFDAAHDSLARDGTQPRGGVRARLAASSRSFA
jgi:hypothetical protein